MTSALRGVKRIAQFCWWISLNVDRGSQKLLWTSFRYGVKQLSMLWNSNYCNMSKWKAPISVTNSSPTLKLVWCTVKLHLLHYALVDQPFSATETAYYIGVMKFDAGHLYCMIFWIYCGLNVLIKMSRTETFEFDSCGESVSWSSSSLQCVVDLWHGGLERLGGNSIDI